MVLAAVCFVVYKSKKKNLSPSSKEKKRKRLNNKKVRPSFFLSQKMDPAYTSVAPAATTTPGAPAAPSKGLLSKVTGFISKNKKIVLILLLIVVGYFALKKFGPLKANNAPNVAPAATTTNVQVPPAPAQVDPNFTRLTAPTAV